MIVCVPYVDSLAGTVGAVIMFVCGNGLEALAIGSGGRGEWRSE